MVRNRGCMYRDIVLKCLSNYLKIEVHAFSKICFFRITFVLAHIEAKCIITVGGLALRQKYCIVEAQNFVTRKTTEERHDIVEFFSECHFGFVQLLQ